MPRSSVLAGALAALALVSGCQTSQPFGLLPDWALDRVDGAQPPAPIAVSGQPSAPATAVPTVSPTLAPPPPAAGGSGGGGAPRPQPIAGRVTDEAGQPLAGVRIEAGGAAVSTAADGSFSLLGPAPGAIATASLPGYTTQTQGPPYVFTLGAMAPVEHAPFTLTGTTHPPVAGATVAYADVAGTLSFTRTDGAGAFTLAVTPEAEASGGMVVVHAGLALESMPRFRLLAAPPPVLGAAAVAAGGTGAISVSMAPATGDMRPQPRTPAGMAASGAGLSLVSPDGVEVPLSGSSGLWPSQVPVFDVPGFKLCLAVSAEAPDGASSVAERFDLKPNAPWKPDMLDAPELAGPAQAGGKVKWSKGARRASIAVYPVGRARPSWEAIVDGDEADLPALSADEAGLVAEISVWDDTDVPFPSRQKGPKKDRRHATRRVQLSQ